MTRFLLFYYWVGIVFFGWAAMDSMLEKHGSKRFWKRAALIPVWAPALLFKRTRNILLLGGH